MYIQAICVDNELVLDKYDTISQIELLYLVPYFFYITFYQNVRLLFCMFQNGDSLKLLLPISKKKLMFL